MGRFIKIGSSWIDLNQGNCEDPHQCEPSTICDDASDSVPAVRETIVDDVIELSSNSDDKNDAENVRRRDNQIILDNKCNNQISRTVPSPNVCQDSAEATCYADEVADRICTSIAEKKKMTLSRKLYLDAWLQHVENKIQEKTNSSNNGVTIYEPIQRVMEDTMKASNNDEDDDDGDYDDDDYDYYDVEFDKGKEKESISEINEDSDSSFSWDEEKLASATHSQLFPRAPLRYGEGSSKYFETETSSPQLNVGECIEEDSHIPMNNIKENSMDTNEKCGDVDDKVMHHIEDIIEDNNVGNENGLVNTSMHFEATSEIDEEERDPKRGKWRKD